MKRPLPPGKAVVLPVRIGPDETVSVPVRLVMSNDGAVLRVLVPSPAGPDPRDAAVRRLLAQVDGALAKPGAPGLHQMRRDAEVLWHLIEQLEDLEALHGPVWARAQRLGAA